MAWYGRAEWPHDGHMNANRPTAPTVECRRVIAERDGSGWLVMWPSGQVGWFPTKSAVLAAIKKSAQADIDLTEVEWR